MGSGSEAVADKATRKMPFPVVPTSPCRNEDIANTCITSHGHHSASARGQVDRSRSPRVRSALLVITGRRDGRIFDKARGGAT